VVAGVLVGAVLVVSPEARAEALDALKSVGGHSASSASSPGARAAAFAGRQVGEPYVMGAQGPNVWDCSGLVIEGWRSAGANWPDTTANGLGRHWPRVTLAKARPGDLLVWDYGPGSRVPGYDHVAIVTTGGRMVEAYAPGVGVRVRKIAGTHPSAVVRPGLRW
jgi:cell wall-associated NlpC family hydrolase